MKKNPNTGPDKPERKDPEMGPDEQVVGRDEAVVCCSQHCNELTCWLEAELAELEEKYESFTTFKSNAAFFGR